MTADISELGHRRQLALEQRNRLIKFPPHINKLSEQERDKQVAELDRELELIQSEMTRANEAKNLANLRGIYGPGYGRSDPGAEDDVKAAGEALEKILKGATDTIRGYAVKVHAAQQAYINAANRAGQRVRSDVLMNQTAQRLAAVAEHAARYGS